MSLRQCLVCDGAMSACRLPGLLKCSQCSYVGADVSLSGEQLAALYDASYFAGGEYSDYLGDRKTTQRNFNRKLRVLLRYVRDPANKSVFEIGAAYGLFLDAARPHFARTSGIDISAEAAGYARRELGLDVAAGDFLDYPAEGPIDVACMWDTIEHLHSPDLYIKKVSALMPAGAFIAVTTGDIGSLAARLRGKRWRQIHPPTHLHYFSKATLAKLLNRYGFTVRYCRHEGIYRSMDMIAAILLTVRRNHPGVYRALKRTGILNFDLYLNLRDLIFVIAEKTHAAS